MDTKEKAKKLFDDVVALIGSPNKKFRKEIIDLASDIYPDKNYPIWFLKTDLDENYGGDLRNTPKEALDVVLRHWSTTPKELIEDNEIDGVSICMYSEHILLLYFVNHMTQAGVDPIVARAYGEAFMESIIEITSGDELDKFVKIYRFNDDLKGFSIISDGEVD